MTRLRGSPLTGAAALLSFVGIDAPSESAEDGALLVYSFFRDVHIIRSVVTKTSPEDYDP